MKGRLVRVKRSDETVALHALALTTGDEIDRRALLRFFITA